MRVADARVADRFRCIASDVAKRRDVPQFGVAESICADVSWRHLLVQSSELRAFRLCYLGTIIRPGARFASFPSVSLPFSSSTIHVHACLTCARLLSGHPVNATGAAIVYVDAYNDNARPRT